MRRLLLLAAALLAIASPTRASVVEDLTLDRALELASDVVLGVVVHAHTDQTPAGAIFTDWTVRVDQPLEGHSLSGDLIVVRHWGGIIGDVGMLVVGEPQFELEEPVLLFLEPWGDFYRSIGLFQGAYSLVEEDDETWAVQKPAGSTLIVRPQLSSDRLPRRLPLRAFLEAIRDAGRQP